MMAEFDQHSGDYRAKLSQSVSLSGIDVDRFAQYKIAFMAASESCALQRTGNFLDFGCGIGLATPHILEQFPSMQLVCADPSAASLQLLTERHSDSVVTMTIGNDLGSLNNASVSLALASCVFHHIPAEERAHWLSELYRVLTPGGCLYIFEHNPLNPATQLIVRTSPLDENAELLTARKTRRLCETAGFCTTSLKYTLIGPPSWNFIKPVERLLSKLPFGAQYVVQATK